MTSSEISRRGAGATGRKRLDEKLTSPWAPSGRWRHRRRLPVRQRRRASATSSSKAPPRRCPLVRLPGSASCWPLVRLAGSGQRRRRPTRGAAVIKPSRCDAARLREAAAAAAAGGGAALGFSDLDRFFFSFLPRCFEAHEKEAMQKTRRRGQLPHGIRLQNGSHGIKLIQIPFPTKPCLVHTIPLTRSRAPLRAPSPDENPARYRAPPRAIPRRQVLRRRAIPRRQALLPSTRAWPGGACNNNEQKCSLPPNLALLRVIPRRRQHVHLSAAIPGKNPTQAPTSIAGFVLHPAHRYLFN